jgi:hypothetical protein
MLMTEQTLVSIASKTQRQRSPNFREAKRAFRLRVSIGVLVLLFITIAALYRLSVT